MIAAAQNAAGGVTGTALRLAAAEQVARIEAGPTGTGLPDPVQVNLSQAARARVEERTESPPDIAPVPDRSADRLLDVRV